MKKKTYRFEERSLKLPNLYHLDACRQGGNIYRNKKKCEYPSDDPIQQVDINNVNISSSIALSKDGAIYELQTK